MNAPAPAPDQDLQGAWRRVTDPDIAEDIAFERLQALHAGAVAPVLAGLVFAVVVAHVVEPYFGALLAWGWCLSKMAIGLVRLLVSLSFARAPQRRLHMRRWLFIFTAVLVVDAISWGLMGALFSQSGHLLVDGLILAGTVGVAAVSLFPLLHYRQLAIPFLAIGLLPIAVAYGLSGQYGSWHVIAGLALYFAVLSVEAIRAERRALELLRLRFENSAIAASQRDALALARHASAAKSRFLATVSHELRTPLNGILGTVALMRLDPLDAKQGERLGVVKQSADHLLTVLGDLLDFSRIEHGRIALQAQVTALATMVHEVTDLLTSLAADRGLRLQLTLAPDLPTHVLCDAARVKQVLHNLSGNALKFTPAGGQVSLCVSLAPSAEEATRSQLHFAVTDSGPGVPQADHERIFQAFEQSANTSTQGHIGTGLGLTISRELARAMGGDVRCRHAPGGGACFDFTLHCVPMPAPEAPNTPTGALLAPLTGHVLLVEDQAVNAMVAQALLEHFGLQVSTVANGVLALASLEQQRPDLVLMDCQMPEMDGWEATRRWRVLEAADPTQARLPIIALTANAVQGDRERCLQAGMDGYLAKPFEPATLHALLSQWLPQAG